MAKYIVAQPHTNCCGHYDHFLSSSAVILPGILSNGNRGTRNRTILCAPVNLPTVLSCALINSVFAES